MIIYDADTDAYVILGVSPEASAEEVEAAYRRAARTWHPDKSPAPDAAENFHRVLKAGEILRDADARRTYDLLRRKHIGRTFRTRREKPPEPYSPMRSPPAWLAPKVRVHMDSVLFTLEAPRTSAGAARFMTGLALVALGGAAMSAEIMMALLAVVLWALGRVFAQPPHAGQLAWAKIIPGRKLAEYHSLDQQRNRYHRLTVPFAQLRVALIRGDADFRIEIHGFPYKSYPLLMRTRDLEEARRCAREAGKWLQLPLVAA